MHSTFFMYRTSKVTKVISAALSCAAMLESTPLVAVTDLAAPDRRPILERLHRARAAGDVARALVEAL